MMKAIVKNEKALAVYSELRAFEPANKDLLIHSAAENIKGIVDFRFLSPIRHSIYSWDVAQPELKREMTKRDLEKINLALNTLNEIAEVPEKGLTGLIHFFAEISYKMGEAMKDEKKSKKSTEKSQEKAIKKMVKNFPKEVSSLAGGISLLITGAIENFIENYNNGKIMTVREFYLDLLRRFEDVPVETYEAMVSIGLEKTLETTAQTTAMEVVYHKNCADDTFVAKVLMRGKKSIIEKMTNIDPNSEKNYKNLKKMENIFDDIYTEENFVKIINILNTPANKAMETALGKFNENEQKRIVVVP